MKAPTPSILAALLAGVALAGCTVNVYSRPGETQPDATDPAVQADSVQVDPTVQSPDPNKPLPPPQTRRRDEITIREGDHPRPRPDTVKVENPPEVTDIGTGRRRPEQPVDNNPQVRGEREDSLARPGVGNGRDESKETHPGQGNANGIEKQQDKDTPKARDDNQPAPDRPGVGRGRDESQQTYPGQGNAKGIEKQDDKEPPGQAKPKEQEKPDSLETAPERGRPDDPGPQADRPNVQPAVTKRDLPEANQGQREDPRPRASTVQPQPGRQPQAPQPQAPAAKPDAKPEQPQPRAEPEPAPSQPQAPAAKPDAKPEQQRQPKAEQEPTTPQAQAPVAKPETRPEQQRPPRANQQPARSAQPEPVAPEPSVQPTTERAEAGPPPELGIDTKDFPAAGKCRVWIEGQETKSQAKARDCDGIEASAPAGSWVLYRPKHNNRILHVKVMDRHQAGIVAHTWIYDAASGRFLHEVNN